MSALRASMLSAARRGIAARTIPVQVRRTFSRTATCPQKKQSSSRLGPLGVEAALKAASDPSFKPHATLQQEFSLTGRVAIISGGNRGLGLEMAETLAEAGAAVYCLDLPSTPGDEWKATRDYVARLGVENARLEYASVDVTDQRAIWEVAEKIGDKEKRMDVCIAAAGILQGYDCLDYPAEEFRKVMDVNTNGVLFTAQAAGRQMAKFGAPGSIILIASMSGSITNKVHTS